MTAVLEPQAPEQSLSLRGTGDVRPQPEAPVALDHPAAPFHCGVAMTAGPVPIASLGWAPLELASSAWSCTCGYTIDGGPAGDPLEAVRLASARMESLQWELDAAQQRFESAVRGASRLGVGQEALSRAAGLSTDELQDVLGGTELL